LLSNGSPSAIANFGASVDFPAAGRPLTNTTMRDTGVTVLRIIPKAGRRLAAAQSHRLHHVTRPDSERRTAATRPAVGGSRWTG
jgi:hypothetical protein